jgi:signal peptidase I
METEWPVEVNAGLLFRVTTTRFNRDSAVPRIVSAFQRDWITYSLALALALTPIPLTLFARNFVSLYDIPSASMEPTLMKGDVLLVEKFPGVYRRTQRGDVVLFKPPSALREIVLNSGSQLSSTSLFVKRLAGVPGDESLRLTDDGTVLIDGKNAVGPDRNQCADEPLRLIDKLLENGKGKEVERLGDDDTYVLGDCKAVSVDSRVFGILPKENIVGKPLARIWPLNRIKLSGPF